MSAGTIVAQGSEPTPQSHPRPDWTDFEPEPIWQAACRAIRSVVSQIKEPEAIRGIAVSSLAESVVPIDSQGQSLAPAIAWFDLRTIAEYEWLQRHGRLRNFVQSFGPQSRIRCSDSAKFSGSKITIRLPSGRPDMWLNFADYVAFRLCGIPATDPSLACRSLAYDLGRGNWASEILEAVGVPPSSFPPVCKSGTPLGSVTPSSAAATNLPENNDCQRWHP